MKQEDVAAVAEPVAEPVTEPVAGSVETDSAGVLVDPEGEAEAGKDVVASSVSVPAADPVSELERILAEAGLTMASTDPEKMKKVQESRIQSETETVRRPVRRRRAPVVVDDGPLIQVDTRKE